jgi:predicted transcriptional regulator YheO
MSIIPKREHLHLYLKGSGDEFLEYGLPTPTFHRKTNNGYYIAWALSGYFNTKKSKTYLIDTRARLLKTFKEYEPELILYKPNYEQNPTNSIQTSLIYNLNDISRHLESLKTASKGRKIQLNIESYEDTVFWQLKIYAENLIQEQGKFIYDQLEDFGIKYLKDEVKDFSTLKAKCRSITRYYEERDFRTGRRLSLKTKEQIMATRKANMTKINNKRSKETEAKVRAAITALEFLQLKVNATSIAKQAGISRPTAHKYLKIINK